MMQVCGQLIMFFFLDKLFHIQFLSECDTVFNLDLPSLQSFFCLGFHSLPRLSVYQFKLKKSGEWVILI